MLPIGSMRTPTGRVAMSWHLRPRLTISTLRAAIIPALLLVAVASTAGCEREPAVDPTAPPSPTATAQAEPVAAGEAARPTPHAATPTRTSVPAVAPSPSPISLAIMTPSPAAVPTATLVPGKKVVTYPCGHGVRQVAHRRFLHWANGTSTLLVDVGDAIWQVDAGGEWVREVVDLDPQSEHDRGPMLYGRHADVSPDGSRIVYATCEYTYYSGTSGRYEIATVNADGTGRQRLTRSTSFENYPVWSPDGTRIAFIANYDLEGSSDLGSSYYEPSETRIFTMAAGGTDVQVVPNTEGVGLYPPVWAPDGERLAFTVNEVWAYHDTDEKRILYTVRIDGSELHRIGEVSTLPTWSPDGERLAFGLKTEDEYSVYTVRSDGSDARMVLDLRVLEAPWPVTGRRMASPTWYPDDFEIRHLSWSPDGSELLIASSWLSTVRPDGSGLRGVGQMGLGPIIDAT